MPFTTADGVWNCQLYELIVDPGTVMPAAVKSTLPVVSKHPEFGVKVNCPLGLALTVTVWEIESLQPLVAVNTYQIV